MLTAVFRGHEGFVVAALVISLLSAAATYIAVRRRVRRPLTASLWAASIMATASLTLWTDAGEPLATCTVNKDVLEPFTTVQGLLNVAMLLPFGLLGVLATRRLPLMAALSILFPALIETAQAVVPFVSRLCDTSDLVANITGALAGTGVGYAANRLTRTPPAATAWRHYAACGAGALAVAGVAAGFITPVVAARTQSDVAAGTDQEKAVASALHDAFGGHYAPQSVTYTPGEGGVGTVMASFPQGAAELTWPSREQLAVNLIPEKVEPGKSFPVPGAAGPVTDNQGAERIAVAYARQFAPWGLKDSKISVQRIDDKANLGWLVSWRQWRGKVLLPMRLDVVIEPNGRLSDLIARHIDAPELPEVKISENQAWKTFDKQNGRQGSTGQHDEGVLLAERRDGAWRVHWRLSVKNGQSVTTEIVDATTGTLQKAQ
ncbi:VanZ family protein [Streptomyces chrestomyceticus]|uniref:VanZ family protein n=1 Tax=Streptomyces chrestomyceticus TaxID=68185 RepID=UPI0033EDE35C